MDRVFLKDRLSPKDSKSNVVILSSAISKVVRETRLAGYISVTRSMGNIQKMEALEHNNVLNL